MTNHKWKMENGKSFVESSEVPSKSDLLPAVHMPTWINPLTFAHHEYFGDAAVLLRSLTPNFQLIRIIGVDHGSVTVDLNLCLWKLELDQLTAALCKLRGAIEDRFAIAPGVVACLDSQRLFRNQFFKRRAIVRKVRAPYGFSRVE